MTSSPAIEATVIGTSIQEALVTVSAESGPDAIKAAAAQVRHYARTNALVDSTSYSDGQKNDGGTYTIRFF